QVVADEGRVLRGAGEEPDATKSTERSGERAGGVADEGRVLRGAGEEPDATMGTEGSKGA
ncbi:hypothetical protein ACWCSH_25010, partial [Streptosporangium sp. NPDC001682]